LQLTWIWKWLVINNLATWRVVLMSALFPIYALLECGSMIWMTTFSHPPWKRGNRPKTVAAAALNEVSLFHSGGKTQVIDNSSIGKVNGVLESLINIETGQRVMHFWITSLHCRVASQARRKTTPLQTAKSDRTRRADTACRH
jgi:hypothetical protein